MDELARHADHHHEVRVSPPATAHFPAKIQAPMIPSHGTRATTTSICGPRRPAEDLFKKGHIRTNKRGVGNGEHKQIILPRNLLDKDSICGLNSAD